MRSIHHTLLHEASERTRLLWAWGFEDAGEFLERAPAGFAEAVLAVLQIKGAWAAVFGWDYNPYNEGLIHGIAGLAALQHPDQVRWTVTSTVAQEDPSP